MIAESVSFIGHSENSEGVIRKGYISVRLTTSNDRKVEMYPEGTPQKDVIEDLKKKGHNPGFIAKMKRWG